MSPLTSERSDQVGLGAGPPALLPSRDTGPQTGPSAGELLASRPIPGCAAEAGPEPVLAAVVAEPVGAVEVGPRPFLGVVQVFTFSLLAYFCVFHLSVVRGSSMSPSIHDGDRILIDPVSYMLHEVERGDIVVLKYPLDPSVDYIKRVVGLPGDEIVIEGGEVWVNGRLLDEPYVQSPDYFCSMRARVQPAHLFVLGDNRARSSDSREFGQVPQDYVRGKVELRLWPIGRAGLIDP